jgi:hypothetical protein
MLETFLHIHLAYLVRKGVKLYELDEVIRKLSPMILVAYGVFSMLGKAMPLESVYPASHAYFKPQAGCLSSAQCAVW